MANYYHAKNYELRPMLYMSGQLTSKKDNVSAGTADFVETGTILNDEKHDEVIRTANADQDLLRKLGMPTFHLITFYAFARKDGYEYSKLVGMADDATYGMFLSDSIEVTPDNLWFNDRSHAILVAAALSQLYASL